MRRALGVLAVLAATLALGACGGGTTTVVTVTSGPTQPDTGTSSATQSSSSGTSGSSGSTGNTGSSGTSGGSGSSGSSGSGSSGGSGTGGSGGSGSGAPPCRASGLELSYLGQQGATGHGELGFAVKNVGSASCHTIGYPGIQFLDRDGNPLPTTPDHTTSDFFGSAPVASLTLSAGDSASFRLGVTHGAAGTADCATAYALQVIPPNDTHSLKVEIPGGAFECRTASVSPMRPGTSAYNDGG